MGTEPVAGMIALACAEPQGAANTVRAELGCKNTTHPGCAGADNPAMARALQY